MSGVTGFKSFLGQIESKAKSSAEVVYKEGAKATLRMLIENTFQDSGNAAFNWHVAPLGVVPPFKFNKGNPPVGKKGDKRTDSGKASIVANAVTARDNSIIIEAAKDITRPGLTFSNDIDQAGGPFYYSNVISKSSVMADIIAGGGAIEETLVAKAYEAVKTSRVGNFVEFS